MQGTKDNDKPGISHWKLAFVQTLLNWKVLGCLDVVNSLLKGTYYAPFYKM